MKDVRLSDWHRLLFGKDSPLFIPEVIGRTIFLYLLLLVAMRLMGRKVASQLSRSELAVILTLGAAIGMPVQVPEAGVLPVVVILAVAILFQRGLSWASQRWPRVEDAAQGSVIVVLREGRMQLEQLKRYQISPLKVQMALRAQGVQHLGQLRRVYLESAGDYTMVRYQEARPGLCILPRPAEEIVLPVHEAHPSGARACAECGALAEDAAHPGSCPYCHNVRFVPAVRIREPRAQANEHADATPQSQDGGPNGGGRAKRHGRAGAEERDSP